MVSSREIVGSLYESTTSLYDPDKNINYPAGQVVLVIEWDPKTEFVYFLLNEKVNRLDAWSFHTMFRKIE